MLHYGTGIDEAERSLARLKENSLYLTTSNIQLIEEVEGSQMSLDHHLMSTNSGLCVSRRRMSLSATPKRSRPMFGCQ